MVEIELKVYMHCKACEKSVLKTLRKYKGEVFVYQSKVRIFQIIIENFFVLGVEEVRTDMEEHKAVVTGQIDPAKILKELKKKTGKRAQVIGKVEDAVGNETTEMNSMPDDNVERDDIAVNEGFNELNQVINFDVFSDENPNGCSIM